MRKQLTTLPGAIRRAYTRDIAFTFRMPSGFAGDVNRTHPFSVIPKLQDVTNPIARYGNAAIYTTTPSARGAIAGDTAVTKIQGIAVRPYPTSQTSSSLLGAPATIGAATPPVTGIIDVLEEGFIWVPIPTGQTPQQTGSVFLWIAATSGAHIQGGFESVTGGASTVTLSNAFWTGGVDTINLVAELQVVRQ